MGRNMTFLGLGVLLLIAVILLVWIAGKLSRPYRYRPISLLSEGEARFAHNLESFLPPNIRLLAKVRIADLLQPDGADDSRFQRTALGRIIAKHVDFVLLDNAWHVLMLIELDDQSHARRDRQRRDRLVDRAFESAGLPLYRVRTKKNYRADVVEIVRLLAERSAQGAAVGRPPAR
jgi:hypothetical protein